MFRDGRLAQLVRAPALQAGGRRFEPCTAHQYLQLCQSFRETALKSNERRLRDFTHRFTFSISKEKSRGGTGQSKLTKRLRPSLLTAAFTHRDRRQIKPPAYWAAKRTGCAEE
jgi:hypothetical protein